MGPAATVDFYRKLIRATPASRDQEHPRVVIWADPTVPDQQEALGGEDPTPWLEEGVQRLVGCGAEVLVAPCNTIHAYLPAVIAGKDLEFISIIDATVDALDHSVHRSRVGLLAADAAVVSGLYQRALQDERLGASSPVNRIPEDVDACHRPSQGRRSECHVEAARRRHLERACRRRSRRRHCWCTEVSVVLEEMEPEIRVDSSTLALRTLERACESPHPSTMEPMPQTQGQDAPPSGHHRRRPAH